MKMAVLPLFVGAATTQLPPPRNTMFTACTMHTSTAAWLRPWMSCTQPGLLPSIAAICCTGTWYSLCAQK